MRLAAAVEYIGTGYAGWQRQHHSETVQGRLEDALSQIANAPVEIVCAGRTDAGVHAFGQIIHFDCAVDRDPVSWLFGANALLPADISLRWVKPVSDNFHARYSAVSRWYRYLILDRNARSALLGSRVTWCKQQLDSDLMHMAGQSLLGENDFSAFRASECQSKTAMRNLSHLSVSRAGSLVQIDVRANAFLHHMVRNIAGVLIAVGNGNRPPEWVAEVLAGKDRKKAGITAPADGLYFMAVQYPPEFGFPDSETTQIFADFQLSM